MTLVYDGSPFNPTPTTPVPPALVFTPDITLTPTPTPIVWMNDDASFRRVFKPFLYMPTAVATARNFCRSARNRQRQHADAQRGA